MPILGPIVWLLNIQYFVVQIVVAAQWAQPFSPLHNTISDLGNTACGRYRGTIVCSPQHALMNLSFIGLGVGMILGALLIARWHNHTSRTALAGIWCMVLAGFGTILVGLFPENTLSAIHTCGASLPFVLGNLALLIFSRRLAMPRLLRIYTAGSGALALIALVLFFTHTYVGLGIGGTERITAYPQTVWLTVFSLYILYDTARRKSMLRTGKKAI